MKTNLNLRTKKKFWFLDFGQRTAKKIFWPKIGHHQEFPKKNFWSKFGQNLETQNQEGIRYLNHFVLPETKEIFLRIFLLTSII